MRSAAKTKANRAKARAYWKKVREGKIDPPRRPCAPPSIEEISRRLAPYCRKRGIQELQIFGSAARGEARRGSDIDLIARFSKTPGLSFFGMEEEIAEILGVPVHLMTWESVDQMANPYRKDSILRDAKAIYHG